MKGQHRVGALIEAPGLLRELGADPADVTASAGLALDILDDSENAISYVALGRLLQCCVSATRCAHFGLLLGQRSDTHSLGLVGRLMRNAPTLGAAMRDLAENQHRYIRGAVPYVLSTGDTAFWGYAIYQRNVPAVEQITDCYVAVGFNMMGELSGLSPDEVLLPRRPPANAAPYKRFFGMTPRFNAEQAALAFSADLLKAPLLNADPRLRKILEASVADYWAIAKPDIVHLVFRILRPQVVMGEANLEAVAKRLSMSPRTLNRRLSAAGTTFRAVLAEVRLEVARQLLAGTEMASPRSQPRSTTMTPALSPTRFAPGPERHPASGAIARKAPADEAY